MSAGEPPDPAAIVAGRIRDRYATPARRAYTYLFRMRPGASLDALIPDPESVIAAWVDEGAGLLPAPPAEAVRRCAAAREVRPHDLPPAQLSPHQRKQMMARSILFIATPQDADRVEVHLWSRALGFSPKGDREARETWLRAAGDFWYSAHRDDDDPPQPGD